MNRRSFVQAAVAAVTGSVSATCATGAVINSTASSGSAPVAAEEPTATEFVPSENAASSGESCDYESLNIKVIGVGGLGGKAVDFMLAQRVSGVDYIFADTEEELSNRRNLHRRIRLGGSSREECRPSYGRAAAVLAQADIRKAIAGTHLLPIVAGLGGSTATGAAPEIARVAKDMGVHVVGIATTPFSREHDIRKINTSNGLAKFQASADSVIVLDNDTLIDLASSPDDSGGVAGSFLSLASNLVQGLAGILLEHGHICIDFEDVKTVLGGHRAARVGFGLATGEDRARIAASSALRCPLLAGVNAESAYSALVIIRGRQGSLMLRESMVAIKTIRSAIGSEPFTLPSTRYDDTLRDALSVTFITAG